MTKSCLSYSWFVNNSLKPSDIWVFVPAIKRVRSVCSQYVIVDLWEDRFSEGDCLFFLHLFPVHRAQHKFPEINVLKQLATNREERLRHAMQGKVFIKNTRGYLKTLKHHGQDTQSSEQLKPHGSYKTTPSPTQHHNNITFGATQRTAWQWAVRRSHFSLSSFPSWLRWCLCTPPAPGARARHCSWHPMQLLWKKRSAPKMKQGKFLVWIQQKLQS